MKITVAESAGFCFGVSRAVEKVYELTEDEANGKIYTVGALIHNKHIVSELEARGVTVIEEEDFGRIFDDTTENDPCTVVIRTHGATKAVTDKLLSLEKQNPFFRVCDMTCPYVKKIHKIVSENKYDKLVVFGDETHPEVKGIVSYANSEAIVISSPEEAEELDLGAFSTIAVAQTTQNTDKWKKTQKILKKVCTNPIIFDTICSVTEKRQTEAGELAKASDLMLIVGGRNSSNTNKLYETAKKELPNTFFIESPSELDLIQF